jgi:hypothetical protein
MPRRNPAPLVNPRDPILGPLKGFLDWVHRRLDAELPELVTSSRTWDPGTVANGAVTSVKLAVAGASLGDPVMASHTRSLAAGVLLAASVTAADEVTVTLVNHSGAAFDLASGTLRASVWRFRV